MEKFGLDSELEAKREAKYDVSLEKKAMSWIGQVVGDEGLFSKGFYHSLKNGVVLCRLINAVSPGSCKRIILNPKHFLEERSNIENYIDGCIKIGVPHQDLITVFDLSESKKDMNQVLQNIYAVARQAQAIGYSGPKLGVNYYVSFEEQQRRTAKKKKEKEEDEIKAREYQETLRVRREQLEQQKLDHRPESVKLTRSKIYSRRKSRKERGRNQLTRSELIYTDSEMSRTPSPVRFGLDLEIQKKREQRYDHQTEEVVLDWLEDMTGEEVDHLWKSLRSGVILCKLMNELRPGMIRKIHTQKVPLLQRENIVHFLDSCSKLGMKNQNLFHVNDLYDKKDLGAVLNCIYNLKLLTQEHPIVRQKSRPAIEREKSLSEEPNQRALTDQQTEVDNPVKEGDVELEETGDHLIEVVTTEEPPDRFGHLLKTLKRNYFFYLYLVFFFLSGGGYYGLYHLRYIYTAVGVSSPTGQGLDEGDIHMIEGSDEGGVDTFFSTGAVVFAKLLPLVYLIATYVGEWKGAKFGIFCGVAFKLVGSLLLALSGKNYYAISVGLYTFLFGGPFLFYSTILLFYPSRSPQCSDSDSPSLSTHINPTKISSIFIISTLYSSGSGFVFSHLYFCFFSINLSIFHFFLFYFILLLCFSAFLWFKWPTNIPSRPLCHILQGYYFPHSIQMKSLLTRSRWFLFYTFISSFLIFKADTVWSEVIPLHLPSSNLSHPLSGYPTPPSSILLLTHLLLAYLIPILSFTLALFSQHLLNQFSTLIDRFLSIPKCSEIFILFLLLSLLDSLLQLATPFDSLFLLWLLETSIISSLNLGLWYWLSDQMKDPLPHQSPSPPPDVERGTNPSLVEDTPSEPPKWSDLLWEGGLWLIYLMWAVIEVTWNIPFWRILGFQWVLFIINVLLCFCLGLLTWTGRVKLDRGGTEGLMGEGVK